MFIAGGYCDFPPRSSNTQHFGAQLDTTSKHMRAGHGCQEPEESREIIIRSEWNQGTKQNLGNHGTQQNSSWSKSEMKKIIRLIKKTCSGGFMVRKRLRPRPIWRHFCFIYSSNYYNQTSILQILKIFYFEVY